MSDYSYMLVGGGARSGKSAFALRLALERAPRRVFLATAEPFDDEMRRRIARHQEERGEDFETVCAPRDLEAAIDRIAREPTVRVVVIDCLTLWLSNLLLADHGEAAAHARVERLRSALARAPFESIVVTNEVGMGLVPETPLGRTFRDVAGRAHQELARGAHAVYFAAMGTVLRLRPPPVEAMR
jgi:adenosylcobinamide kinase/adenosylcobinamide-phosphate guanylyltransferase